MTTKPRQEPAGSRPPDMSEMDPMETAMMANPMLQLLDPAMAEDPMMQGMGGPGGPPVEAEQPGGESNIDGAASPSDPRAQKQSARNPDGSNDFPCGSCGEPLTRYRGDSIVTCPNCLTDHNSSGQRYRRGWERNPSNFNEDISDSEGELMDAFSGRPDDDHEPRHIGNGNFMCQSCGKVGDQDEMSDGRCGQPDRPQQKDYHQLTFDPQASQMYCHNCEQHIPLDRAVKEHQTRSCDGPPDASHEAAKKTGPLPGVDLLDDSNGKDNVSHSHRDEGGASLDHEPPSKVSMILRMIAYVQEANPSCTDDAAYELALHALAGYDPMSYRPSSSPTDGPFTERVKQFGQEALDPNKVEKVTAPFGVHPHNTHPADKAMNWARDKLMDRMTAPKKNRNQPEPAPESEPEPDDTSPWDFGGNEAMDRLRNGGSSAS